MAHIVAALVTAGAHKRRVRVAAANASAALSGCHLFTMAQEPGTLKGVEPLCRGCDRFVIKQSADLGVAQDFIDTLY
jgi:hypothetical protein